MRDFMMRMPVVAVLLAVLATACCREPRQPGDVSVVLIVIDALRADHLGCYGYGRDTSPVLDSLASQGCMWTRVQAQSPWTLPSVSSIMTGLDVRTHGAGRRGADVCGFDPSIPTLATLLHDEGYSCWAFFNVYLLSPDFGFHRGFDRYRCNDLGHGAAAATVDTCITWLDRLPPRGNFLMVIHLFDVHDPYEPPPPCDTLFGRDPSAAATGWTPQPGVSPLPPGELGESLLTGYDCEIRWVDGELGRLFSRLREDGLSDRTVVVVTSDHGEEFLDHGGFGHGKTMFQEVLDIPLVMSGPGIPPGTTDGRPAGQIDILPTILALAGIEVPPGVQGSDLTSDRPDPLRILPSSNVNSGSAPVTAAARAGDLKLIWDVVRDVSVTYDLSSDPREASPLPPDSFLRNAVMFYWASPVRGSPVPVDRQRIDRALRDLGYF